MADDIEIPIGGGETIKVPRWATEETVKEMSKFNEASAKALTSMLAANKRSHKTVIDNQKMFKTLKDATKKDTVEQLKTEKKLNEFKSKHSKALKTSTKSLTDTSKNMLEAFNKNSLAGVAAALAGIVGMGAAAGFAVGAVESFAKNVSELSNVGLGLGTTLIELRSQATLTGLNIADYGKLVASSGDTLRAMGDNAQDGARQFSILSNQARFLARDFNNFGLTNQEYNEYLLAEIEIRRKSGMSQSAIISNVSAEMNKLLVETSALSAMTGQDRREMMRSRHELLNDSSITAYRMAIEQEGGQLAENFGSLATVFGAGGDVGKQLGAAIATSIATGIDFRAVNNGAMAGVASINSNASSQLSEIDRFVKDNLASMNTGEFNARLVSLLAELGDAIPATELRTLGILADNGNEAAASLITLMSEVQGLETSIQANRDAQDQNEQALRDTDVLALPSTIEELTNRIRDSALSTVLESLSLDLDEAGENLIDALRLISDNFGPTVGLGEGLKDSYADLTTGMDRLKHAAMLATAAIALLAITAGGRSLVGSAVGRIRGARTGLPAAPRVATAPRTPAAPRTPLASRIATLARGTGRLASKLPVVGNAINAGLGIVDTDYQEAGHDVVDRGMFGMAEGLLDLGDVTANAVTFLADAVAGVGPGWNNDLDMSGAFKDFMVNGASPMNAPSFDPSTQRIDTDHMITRNATVQNNGAIQSGITPDNAFRHGDRGEDYLRQIAAAAANQAAEIARMRRAFEESQ